MADNPSRESKVYYEEPPARPAPIPQTGLVAWVRENLLKTTFDSIVTVLMILLLFTVISGSIAWMVRDANWFSIIFNFRQFMVGRLAPALEWRVALAAVLAVFVCGMAVRIWVNKLARTGAITLAVLLFVFLALPRLILGLVDVPAAYFTAGNTDIVAGTATETPLPQVAFIAKAGETITVRYSTDIASSDAQLADLNGFMDAAANTLRNAAGGLRDTISRQAELRDQLARDLESDIPLFTEAQRAAAEEELAALEIEQARVEAYAVNTAPFTVRLLDGRAMAPIAAQSSGDETVILQPGERVSWEIPDSGWYILEKTPADPESTAVALFSTEGIYSILQSTSFFDRLEMEDGTIIEREFVDTYVRMIDNYRITTPVPEIDGEEVPFVVVTANQYRGKRSVEAFLRVYVAPFLERHGTNASILVVAAFLGYMAAMFFEQQRSQSAASKVTTLAFMALPLLIWFLVAGFTVKEIFSLSLVGAALAYIAFMYGMGMRYGRNPITLVVLLGLGLVIAVIQPIVFNSDHGGGLMDAITHGKYGTGLPPILNLVALVPATLAMLTGSSQFGVRPKEEVNASLTRTGAILAALILVPLVVSLTGTVDPAGSYPDWPLRASDKSGWGGFLLTMMLTIFGIIAAFPLGVLLALGRRSDLPAIKVFSTLYIELIRGSPFIVVLFMMQLMIPLIDPSLAEIPNTIRALVAAILFSSAYLAENVRGGLQALPPGQVEAAKAVGMSGWQIVLYITLPQALRVVIPALVGQFIGLFKDTSLVAIVGLIDLTGYVNTMVVQAEFIGTRLEGLFFITVIYFVFSYVMGYVSRLLEASGSGAARRI